MSDGTSTVLSAILQTIRWERIPSVPWSAVRIVDCRAAVKEKLKAAPERRPIEYVHTVVAHQLDVELGLTQRQIDAAGGDKVEALIRRAMRLPYHVVGLLCGVVVLNHDPTIRTYHASAGNGGLGLGLEGSYPTLASERSPTHTSIDRIAEVARIALRQAVGMIAAPGKRLELQAHRQWDGQRTRDPGEELWKVLRPVADELGLVIDPELRRVAAGGRPIPIEWDERGRYDLSGKAVRRDG